MEQQTPVLQGVCFFFFGFHFNVNICTICLRKNELGKLRFWQDLQEQMSLKLMTFSTYKYVIIYSNFYSPLCFF